MLGIFGCDKIGNVTQTESETETEDTTEKDTAEIKKTVAECVTALSNFDAKSVYALTDWEKDDDSYKELASLLDIDSHAKKKGNDLAECYKFIASTLTCSADTGVIDIDGDRATYRVQFKTMDWKAVYTGLYGQYHSYAEVLADLKLKKVEYNSPLYVQGKFTLVKRDGGWMINQISGLKDLFAFVNTMPLIEASEGDTESDPTGTLSDQDKRYREAVTAYVKFLKTVEDKIKKAEKIYNKPFVNLYDLDGDGVLDLLFVMADNVNYDYSSASLYICTYDFEKKSIVEKIKIPEIAYCAEGGSFYIYVTAGNIVITHRYGEEALSHVVTEVYNADFPEYKIKGFSVAGTFRRDVYYDYDPVKDKETYKYEYFFALDGKNFKKTDEKTYKESVSMLAGKCVAIIGYDHLPQKDDIEYEMTKGSDLSFAKYDDVIECYKSYCD